MPKDKRSPTSCDMKKTVNDIKTNADGSKYVGQWKDAKKHGQATQTWPDGKTFEGTWENNEERMGTMTLADGTVQKGRFENRKFVGP